MSCAPGSNPRCIPGPAHFGMFVMGTGDDGSWRGEWVAPITQYTDVVVSDVEGAPSRVGVEKADAFCRRRSALHLDNQDCCRLSQMIAREQRHTHFAELGKV